MYTSLSKFPESIFTIFTGFPYALDNGTSDMHCAQSISSERRPNSCGWVDLLGLRLAEVL
jgi:hypothetical protein